jgi:ferredoxin like protein
MKFQYEDCVECGTCYIMCDQGAVSWNHPRGGFGITYSQG